MQLLFEEFFKKVYGLSKGKTSIFLLILVRIMIYGTIIILIGLIVYAVVIKKYIYVLILLGLVIIGEVAHYIRKSREKNLDEKVPKDSSKEYTKELLKSDIAKNKSLLKTSKPKNKSLLGKNKKLLGKSKNERLLRK